MPVSSLEIIILAAGKGKRMHSSLPKVLHQVAGKPLLGHVIDAAAQLEPVKIHVVVGHGKDQVIGQFAKSSGDYPEIDWVEQLEQLGTGHAVQQVIPNIAQDSSVLMLTADVPLISPDTLMPLCSAMPAFPLALLTAELSDPTGLGRIIRDDTNSVCGIVEEKDASPLQRTICEINSGIMCARAGDLRKWLALLDNDNAQAEYYLTDIVEIASGLGNPICALQPQQNFEVEGINSRAQLARVERIYQRQQADRLMESGVTIIDPARVDIRGEVNIGSDTVLDVNTLIIGPTTIGKNVRIAPNCVITASQIGDHSALHPNTVVEQAVVGENVNVGPFARLRPGTQLSNDVRVGNFVEIKNAQLADGSKVNHLSYVGDATVGRNTN
ncbi:MAG: bifunctional UDP-N-acetylglucosamine diphosphorylase/glucosamine-1-phosphate N-acetyltransferase GlmU, partial [Gammaproteobacteria bacterium]|nr:bifunctional UDP-N-acetylglucosamine diphosphorylase/glucosamine-1-phosphate N-acetyltransferase GlmU [Gammaproteobacteria bacterium]